jgi:hypothetical protein
MLLFVQEEWGHLLHKHFWDMAWVKSTENSTALTRDALIRKKQVQSVTTGKLCLYHKNKNYYVYREMITNIN